MATGLSVHIGLNQVDPAAYDGWSGELGAGEQDAVDMARLADAAGFDVTDPLLSGAAIAETVTATLEAAAARLAEGDILFLSYAGHGGQVPDLNHDETGDRLDETWVLYDRQLVDDELFELFGKFAKGVRIWLLSDSCHSGTVAGRLAETLSAQELDRRFRTVEPEEVGRRIRAMPQSVQSAVYRRDRDAYDRIQNTRTAKDLTRIDASVLKISGCQDNQTSADGIVNGLFTGTLLEVWRDGAFAGSYRGLHREVVRRMPPDQTPDFVQAGVANPAFVRQRPFTI
ncbi:caspase family protein [Streptomyces hygroscopicus subsp. hygroscopicus]|uniref:caspase family protein n=1 Tax=Streptomyces hygroscopicus TaxID=1912 RepID=UPI001C66126B|nr:caspase family protein [Streptomyces hygroscopicus]MBW8086705.1 caspase family protein [Streptomyces hygroscopicus subsp. hygroscopicus]